jgi:hypothetical protein
MSHFIGLMIETLVAVLLMVTIGYCVLLNRRLQRLRADEQSLKATISELITATEIAERAIGGLKLTVHDCDNNLGGRLSTAEQVTQRLAIQIASGEEVLTRLSRIVLAARPLKEAEPKHPASAQSLAAAAQAFAERTSRRVNGVAA